MKYLHKLDYLPNHATKLLLSLLFHHCKDTYLINPMTLYFASTFLNNLTQEYHNSNHTNAPLTISRRHCTPKSQSPPVWHMGQFKLWHRHSSLQNWPLTTETSGLSGPHYWWLRGLSPEGYGSISSVETMKVNTGHIFEYPNQYSHLIHPTNQPWRGLPPNGVDATMPPATATPGIIPKDLQYTRQPGIWAHTGHPGSTDRRIWPTDYYGDQYHRPRLLSQQVGIRRGVLAGDHDIGWWRAGGSGTGRPLMTPGLEHRVNALPRAECGNLWGRCWWQTEPSHWRIPPFLHHVSLIGIGGGSDTLPGPGSHSVRGPQRQHPRP